MVARVRSLRPLPAAPWVVVRVKWRQERVAARNVENQGAQFYAPMALERGVHSRVLRPAPLFPGYAFARHPAGRWTFLRSTNGVTDVLMSSGERAALVPDAEIARLRAREGPDGLVRLDSREFTPGERVRVEHGPLSLAGVVEGLSARDRIFVLLEFLGGLTRVEVDVKDIYRD